MKRQDGRLAEHAGSKTSYKRLRMGVLGMENVISAPKSCHRGERPNTQLKIEKKTAHELN